MFFITWNLFYKKEGITDEDNKRLGNSPFMTMSVTRDYDRNIHMKLDDVSYGFFVWFGAHGEYCFLFFQFLLAYVIVDIVIVEFVPALFYN